MDRIGTGLCGFRREVGGILAVFPGIFVWIAGEMVEEVGFDSYFFWFCTGFWFCWLFLNCAVHPGGNNRYLRLDRARKRAHYLLVGAGRGGAGRVGAHRATRTR